MAGVPSVVEDEHVTEHLECDRDGEADEKVKHGRRVPQHERIHGGAVLRVIEHDEYGDGRRHADAQPDSEADEHRVDRAARDLEADVAVGRGLAVPCAHKEVIAAPHGSQAVAVQVEGMPHVDDEKRILHDRESDAHEDEHRVQVARLRAEYLPQSDYEEAKGGREAGKHCDIGREGNLGRQLFRHALPLNHCVPCSAHNIDQ